MNATKSQNAYKMSKVMKVPIFSNFRIFTTFSNFPFYMEFWVFKWRLSLTRELLALLQGDRPHVKVTLFSPYKWGRK